MLRLVGCSHQNTSIDQREQLLLNKELRMRLIEQCLQGCSGRDIIVIVTCNRIDIFSYGFENHDIIDCWSRLVGVESTRIMNCCYQKQGQDALSYWASVAVGMDSAMVGEPDILGQVKKACQESRDLVGNNSVLFRLSQWVIKIAKQVRIGSGVGQHATSFVSMAQMLAKRLFTDWKEVSILLIGSGDVIESALGLWSSEHSNIMVCNRSLAKANEIAARYGVKAVGLSHIPDLLKSVDCVISATSSPLPLIGKGMIEKAIEHQSRPMLLIDLAMPRDIEPEASSIEEVYLYHLDDLKLLAKEGESRRKQGRDLAKKLIAMEIIQFQKQMNLWGQADSISQFRSQLNALGEQEQLSLIKNLRGEENVWAKKSLEAYHRKVMHHATVLMKEVVLTGVKCKGMEPVATIEENCLEEE
ncbi:MAG TPA: glutamyl-tRNA reductase [Gammaproteobacteria bacterium]|nr:glutamyl-tRNA reductase [Gammaproteobacteria bacterium]